MRVAPGHVLESAALDLRAEVLDSDRNIFRADVYAGSGGNGGPLHRHLRQEERFIVSEGALLVRQGFRGRRLVGPGEEVAIRPGRPHTFEVASEHAHFIAEFRPAWEIAQVFRDVFELGDRGSPARRGHPRPRELAELVDRYPDDFFYSPFLPLALQRAIARALAGSRRRKR